MTQLTRYLDVCGCVQKRPKLLLQAPISSFAHMLYTLRKSEVASTQKVEDVAGVSGALVDQPDGSVRFEVKGMPESPRARLTTLFQVCPIRYCRYTAQSSVASAKKSG